MHSSSSIALHNEGYCFEDDEDDYGNSDESDHESYESQEVCEIESQYEEVVTHDNTDVIDNIDVEQCLIDIDDLGSTTNEAAVNSQPWRGFKLVGDNLDKNFRRRFQRVDYQTQSFHFFHLYALLDRIDLSQISDDDPKSVMIQVEKVLPDGSDIDLLRKNLSILISR